MHNDKPLLETIGDKIGDELPAGLHKSEGFAYGLGTICGFLSGWLVVKKAAELLFTKEKDQ